MWKKKYVQAHNLATLNCSEGTNYVIQNAASGATSGSGSGDSQLLVLTWLGGNQLGVTGWKGDLVPQKIFKVEPCSDNGGQDCVVSSCGTPEIFQWVLSDSGSTVEMRRYPTNGAERLRPPMKQWRFKFEPVEPCSSKRYRIICMDEELIHSGAFCLRLGDFNQNGYRLEFTGKNDSDQSQLWCLHQR